jgi:hypothetical protein
MATMTKTRVEAKANERIEDDQEDEDIAQGVPEPFMLPIDLRIKGQHVEEVRRVGLFLTYLD